MMLAKRAECHCCQVLALSLTSFLLTINCAGLEESVTWPISLVIILYYQNRGENQTLQCTKRESYKGRFLPVIWYPPRFWDLLRSIQWRWMKISCRQIHQGEVVHTRIQIARVGDIQVFIRWGLAELTRQGGNYHWEAEAWLVLLLFLLSLWWLLLNHLLFNA